MTVTTPGGEPGTGVAVPFDENEWNVGMEDVGASDLVIPRLKIIHDECLFENNLTKERWSTLQCIVIGQVKQRIMWDDEVSEGGTDRPQCRSSDFTYGFPNLRTDIPVRKQFPWEDSNFKPEHLRVIDKAQPTQDHPEGFTSNGIPCLPCASCKFTAWGADRKPPRCAEQHTYVILYTLDGGVSHTLALLTLQKSSIKPSKEFISGMAQSKQPIFSVYTEIKLLAEKRGSVSYATAQFIRGAATRRENWREYANQITSIRGFLRQAPRPADDADLEAQEASDPWATSAPVAPTPPPQVEQTQAASVPTPEAAPPAAPAPAPVAPVPAPAAVVPPAPAPAPVAPPAPTAAPPSVPVPAPVPVAAPAPVPVPAAAASPAPAAVATAPASVPVPGGSEDDDLPF